MRTPHVRSTSTDISPGSPSPTTSTSTSPEPSTDITTSPKPRPFGSNIPIDQSKLRPFLVRSGEGIFPKINTPSLAAISWQYRGVILHNLDLDTTLADITQGIADTAPAGMVREVRFATQPAQDFIRSALVVFHSSDAPLRLAKAAREKVFQVRGKTPYVELSSAQAAQFKTKNDTHLWVSRVLDVRGMPEEFAKCDVEAMKEVIRTHPASKHEAQRYGLESEPIRWEEESGGQTKSEHQIFVKPHKRVSLIRTKLTLTLRAFRQVLWAFFSFDKQAIPFRAALKSYFSLPHTPQLIVNPSVDPCLKTGHWQPFTQSEREELILFHRRRKASRMSKVWSVKENIKPLGLPGSKQALPKDEGGNAEQKMKPLGMPAPNRMGEDGDADQNIKPLGKPVPKQV